MPLFNALDFLRYDDAPDEIFYSKPRFVTHMDERALAAVTQLYRDYFPAHGVILDLMSSWVSHLPDEISYRQVVGLGMNKEELMANPRLTAHAIHNLNANPALPFADAQFDAAGICASIDYLIKPMEVLREVGRVLRENAPLVITFSNRVFPTKAIAAWLNADDFGKQKIVERYLVEAGNWVSMKTMDRSAGPGSDPLYAVIARSSGPFVNV
jgi:SAM-dependent methyltransferase